MTQDIRPKQHRKFIALVLAAAMAVTGASAVPAKAGNDAGKVIAGLAVLGILGAVLHDHNTRDRRETVTRPHHPQRPHRLHGGHRPHHPTPKPLPPRFGRYDLPAKCVKTFPRYSRNRDLVARGCLKRNYQFEHKLPQACKVTFWNGQKNRTGYKPRCLNKHGYRLVHR